MQEKKGREKEGRGKACVMAVGGWTPLVETGDLSLPKGCIYSCLSTGLLFSSGL